MKRPVALPSIGPVRVKRNRKFVSGASWGRTTFLAAAAAVVLTACDGGSAAPESGSFDPRLATTEARPAIDAAEVLASAGRMLRDGRFEDAAEAARTAAAAAPDPTTQAEARLAAAVALYETGDQEGSVAELREAVAVAAPESTAHRRASYLLAVRLSEAGDHVGAVDALRELASTVEGDALQPYIVAEYARGLGRLGEDEAAEERWNALLASPATPEELVAAAYRGLADIARERGDRAGQVRWLQLAVAIDEGPGTHFELAMAAREVGDTDTFATHLRRIVTEFPASWVARPAIDELRAAGIGVDPGAEGLVYYRHGMYAEAQGVLEYAVGETEGDSPANQAFEAFYLGAAHEDGGNAVEAIAAYDLAAAQDPGSDYAHRARYWAARVMESLGDAPSASARYAALVREGPQGDFTRDAARRAGQVLLDAGDLAGAVAVWDSLGVQDPEILYWKGRALEALGNGEGASAAYEAAMAAGPLDFYGEEAARKLGLLGDIDVRYEPLPAQGERDWASIEGWLAERTGGAPLAGAPTVAGEFLAVGLRREAIAVLRRAADTEDPWQVLRVLREADELGLPEVTTGLAVRLQRLVGAPSHEVPKALLQLAYPIGYPELVDEVARKNDLDPLFVAAMVRQESAWDRTAGSHAGALGLTQVIPPTGEGIAQSIGYDGFQADDLFRPAVSLEFGAHYLAVQFERWGDPYRALAAYNAGPGNVERWNEMVGGPTGADWVAALDIAETKGYVVYVMEHYAHYRQAWR